uniref:Dirigent protein n=1 Tax=Oryza punctata TaxID=4537 RepID=A0A0E0L2Z3_ORYPU
MGRVTVAAAAVFVAAAMAAAVSGAHGARVLEERMWRPVGMRVVSAGNWPNTLDSLPLGDPNFAGAGGPAASAGSDIDGKKGSGAFVHGERFGERQVSINVYDKIPLFGP